MNCVERVWSSLGNGHGITQICGKKGKVEHDGKWYCGMHSPEAKAKRQAKSDERDRQLREKRDAQYEIEIFNRSAGAVCRALNIADPAELLTKWQRKDNP